MTRPRPEIFAGTTGSISIRPSARPITRHSGNSPVAGNDNFQLAEVISTTTD
jgi:hypothetical protein